ncbi:MAG TPA: protein glxC [Alphaproteobacteria bacterium]|jgi:glutamate synthase domain-containing protein 3|nr:protein glxC [Alphaproteobacteria bacterium]
MPTVDLRQASVRELNRGLHALGANHSGEPWTVLNPMGGHAVAVGLEVPVEVEIEGHVGYYCAGMNKEASIVVRGNVGTGFGENIMSGVVRCTGNASQSLAASGHGGLVVVEGDASARSGISMKGVDIVVGGSIGHMGAFLAQAGHLVVCGDSGAHLGDSIYEAVLFVRGEVESLGSDCLEKEMRPEHLEVLEGLLERSEISAQARDFRRYGSARQLYNFKIDQAGSY